jgi:hypothetical protein
MNTLSVLSNGLKLFPTGIAAAEKDLDFGLTSLLVSVILNCVDEFRRRFDTKKRGKRIRARGAHFSACVRPPGKTPRRLSDSAPRVKRDRLRRG